MLGLSIFHQLPAWQLTLQTYLHIICLDKYFYTLSSERKYETVLYVLRFLLHIFTQPIIFSFKCSKMFFISEEQIENRSEVIFSHFSNLIFYNPQFCRVPDHQFKCREIQMSICGCTLCHNVIFPLARGFATDWSLPNSKYNQRR